MTKRLKLTTTALLISAAFYGSPSAAAPAKQPQPAGVVNINTANVQQLMLLPRIGPTKAQRVIQFRERRKFKSPRQIVRVPGIGYKTYKKLKLLITVQGPTTLTQRPIKQGR